MTKPNTPLTDKLAAMPPGPARDVFYSVNQRGLQAESGQLQAFEASTTSGRAAARIELARKMGCAELAHLRELERDSPVMANIYRESNRIALAQQEQRIAALEEPTDDGPQAA